MSSELKTIIKEDLRSEPWVDKKVTISAAVDQLIVKKKQFIPMVSFYRDKILKELDSLKIENYDVLHLHWIIGIIPSQKIIEISKKVPLIVWTMHDFFPLTGACHYPLDCSNFKNDCKECPAVRRIFQGEVSRRKINKEKLLGEIANIQVVFPSHWMREKFKEFDLNTRRNPKVIYNPVSDEFYGDSVRDERIKLGISSETYVLGFMSKQIHNPIKRFDLFLKILEVLSIRTETKIVGLIVGDGYQGGETIGKAEIINLGLIESESDISSFYKTIDIFVSTSLSESFGMGLAEALAAGIKILAFDNSTARELISSNTVGNVVNSIDEAVSGLLHRLESKIFFGSSPASRCYDFRISSICEQYNNVYQENTIL